jgi:hypothetical protein
LRWSDRDSALTIPDHFWSVPYKASRVPGAAGTSNVTDGANCQTFAYAVLRHFGRTIPDFRSSELWRDRKHTFVVSAWEPLDLVLFGRSREAFGAHIGVCAGDRILHLCRSVGRPVLWDLCQFSARPAYCVTIGAKRTRN